MDNERISLAAKRYNKYSLWIVVGLSLVALTAMSVVGAADAYITPLIVSVLFSIGASVAYSAAWQATAKASPTNLTKLYLAAGGVRMLAAALVVVVYSLLNREKQAILGFTAVFCTYYVALLIFDSVYFAKLEKRSKPDSGSNSFSTTA